MLIKNLPRPSSVSKRIATLALVLGSIAWGQTPPNVIVILMDDYGVGQFAPMIKGLSAEEIDPEHLEFVLSLGEQTYDPEQALAFAKKAMPTMDRLANEGVLFQNAFSSSNLCAAARAGLITGNQQTRWGGFRNTDISIAGIPEGSSLAQRLQTAGYATGMIGKWHIGEKDPTILEAILPGFDLDPTVSDRVWRARPEVMRALNEVGYFGSVVEKFHPHQQGFDYYFGYNRWECPYYDYELVWENTSYTGKQSKYNTELFTDKAIAFAKRAIEADQAFFVELAYHAMHDPIDPLAPEKYRAMFNSGNEYLDKYFSHLYAVDLNIQRMLDALDAQGALDNTLVVFTADNGATCTTRSVLPGNAPHHGYKGNFFQGGFKVPLVMWKASGIAAGTRPETPVSIMDILPTALDLAGLETPQAIDGKSLRGLLEGETSGAIHEQLILAGIHSRAWGFGRYGTPGDPDEWRENSPSGWVVLRDPYILRYVSTTPAGLHPDLPQGAPESWALHNFRKDPLERHNLKWARPAIVEELSERYAAYAETIQEPHYLPWREESRKALFPAP